MLTMQAGDIWQCDRRPLYLPGTANYRVEHWLILDVMPGDKLAHLFNYTSTYYKPQDVAIHYLCLESGRQTHKIFSRSEWCLRDGVLDLTGNPYYKKVS